MKMTIRKSFKEKEKRFGFIFKLALADYLVRFGIVEFEKCKQTKIPQGEISDRNRDIVRSNSWTGKA